MVSLVCVTLKRFDLSLHSIVGTKSFKILAQNSNKKSRDVTTESRQNCCSFRFQPKLTSVTKLTHNRAYSVPLQIPVEVKISVPQPYDVIKKYPVKVKEVQKYTVEVPKVIKIISKFISVIH